MTEKEYIVQEYGEPWLKHKWSAGDVMDIMEDYGRYCSEEVEKHTYTAQDMEAFAEWCSENGWNISIKKHRWVNDNGEGIFTKQLCEMWEQERREK